jgi:hypothetical protein
MQVTRRQLHQLVLEFTGTGPDKMTYGDEGGAPMTPQEKMAQYPVGVQRMPWEWDWGVEDAASIGTDILNDVIDSIKDVTFEAAIDTFFEFGDYLKEEGKYIPGLSDSHDILSFKMLIYKTIGKQIIANEALEEIKVKGNESEIKAAEEEHIKFTSSNFAVIKFTPEAMAIGVFFLLLKIAWGSAKFAWQVFKKYVYPWFKKVTKKNVPKLLQKIKDFFKKSGDKIKNKEQLQKDKLFIPQRWADASEISNAIKKSQLLNKKWPVGNNTVMKSSNKEVDGRIIKSFGPNGDRWTLIKPGNHTDVIHLDRTRGDFETMENIVNTNEIVYKAIFKNPYATIREKGVIMKEQKLTTTQLRKLILKEYKKAVKDFQCK